MALSSDTMSHGRAMQQGWERRVPFFQLTREELECRLGRTKPGARVRAVEPLRRGRRHSSYRVLLEGRARPVVARFFTADPAVCGKEVALARLLPDLVPLPE